MLSLIQKHFSKIFVAILILFGIVLIYSSRQIFIEIDKSNPSQKFVNATRYILIIGIVFLMMGVGIIMCEKSCNDCKIISFTNDTQNYYIIASLFVSIIGFYLGYTIKNEKLGPDSIYWGNLITFIMFISILYCSYFIFKKYNPYKNLKNKVVKKDITSNYDDFSYYDSDNEDSDFGNPETDGRYVGMFGNQQPEPGTETETENEQNEQNERTAFEKAEDNRKEAEFWDLLSQSSPENE